MKTTGYSFDAGKFGYPKPFVITSVLSVRERTSGYSGIHMQQEWVLDYSLTNCGHCRVGGEKEPWLPRGPGIAHLYPPKTRYWEMDAPPPFSSAYIIFSGGETAGFDKLTANAKGFARFTDPEGVVGSRLTEMACVGAAQGDNAFCKVMELFYQLAALLNSAPPLPSGFEFTTSSSKNVRLAEKAQGIIAERLDEPLSLAALSKELGISESTLSHKYRKETGESPLQTQLRLRINLAKGLLLKGESVKATAAKTGFYDEFHFSRTFKRLTGKSPSAYSGEMSGRILGKPWTRK